MTGNFKKIVLLYLKFIDKVVHLEDKTFETFLSASQIGERVEALAGELNKAYEGKPVVFIAILNGAFMFAADLLKKIDIPDSEITFVKVSSYVGTNSSGRVDELIGLNCQLSNKHVVILEDIVDTGITMDKVITLLEDDQPLSVSIASLLFKPEAFTGKHRPDYIGFSIPNKFVVGYGLDYNEKGRGLEAIYQLKIP